MQNRCKFDSTLSQQICQQLFQYFPTVLDAKFKGYFFLNCHQLKPTSDKINEIQTHREAQRRSQFFNHLSAVSESIPALGWVAVVRHNSFNKFQSVSDFILRSTFDEFVCYIYRVRLLRRSSRTCATLVSFTPTASSRTGKRRARPTLSGPRPGKAVDLDLTKQDSNYFKE